ncbi:MULTISPECIES: hypothetical protein [unclassified Ruegeria]|uniref:hypothetical protein n=1 Tax=unclassified Ruegeria TaxID=2625375 RepID=UPI001AD976E7|nr:MULTISPECIES: hypothetical protein [unclassified Ruegeria]MBO9412348.1 hypothetical protein [Ruegeria sp. R8_1]MBO9416414.1 hypothetical protein [Ruegeria sp. R8_2]
MNHAAQRKSMHPDSTQMIDRGHDSLFGSTFVLTNPVKTREKKRKVVHETIAFRMDEERPIPRELLAEVGLTPEDNPRVQVYGDSETPL